MEQVLPFKIEEGSRGCLGAAVVEGLAGDEMRLQELQELETATTSFLWMQSVWPWIEERFVRCVNQGDHG